MLFTGGLVRLLKDRLLALTCIADPGQEAAMRGQMNQGAALAGQATAEQWEGEGKLLFLPAFALSAMVAQEARRQGR
jgi:hypothetical protein